MDDNPLILIISFDFSCLMTTNCTRCFHHSNSIRCCFLRSVQLLEAKNCATPHNLHNFQFSFRAWINLTNMHENEIDNSFDYGSLVRWNWFPPLPVACTTVALLPRIFFSGQMEESNHTVWRLNAYKRILENVDYYYWFKANWSGLTVQFDSFRWDDKTETEYIVWP